MWRGFMETGLRRGQVLVLLGASLLLLLSSLPPSLGAPNKKAVAAARKEDIPFIRCQVCEKIAHQLYHQVKKKEAQISPKKISELQIIEIAEDVCSLKKEGADWLLRIDIVEKGDALELVEQESEGQCNSECKTLERACQEVMGYSDTDVAEYMYTSKASLDSLVKFLCHDLTKSCLTKPPPVPKDRVPGEPFVPKSSKDAEMEKILRSMEGMPGAPSMKMYSREDLLNNNFGGEETDDEEDEDNFPSNLGKVLRNKDSGKGDLKQRIFKGIKQTTTAVRSHVNKVSHRIQKWWKGRANSKSPKAAKGEL